MRRYDMFDFDDPVFPTSREKQVEAGMILESSTKKGGSAPDPIASFAGQQARTQAMSAVLGWIEAGEYSYTALEEFVVAVADLDGDFEIGDDEVDDYNEIWQHVPDALQTLGAGVEDVNDLVNGEDDAAAKRVGDALSKAMGENKADDADIIAGFAFGEAAILEDASDDPEGRHMILEAAYKNQKVVRDGKVQVVRKRVSGKVRLSAAQKAALRKARRKANTGAAKLARRKSAKIRKSRGM